ncbi:MAG: sensor domain-containing diguanylate cyclase [Fibrobacterales bacterium]|nr:sensor domain-containing diguanylate cyclase [Fibrobacterales bacterium]
MKTALQSIALFLFAVGGVAARGWTNAGGLDFLPEEILRWREFFPLVLFLLLAVPMQGLLLFSDRHGSTSPLGTMMLAALAWLCLAVSPQAGSWAGALPLFLAFALARCGGARLSVLFAPFLFGALECLVSHRAIAAVGGFLPEDLLPRLPASLALRDVALEFAAAEAVAVAFACVGLSQVVFRGGSAVQTPNRVPSQNVAQMVDEWDGEDEEDGKDGKDGKKGAPEAAPAIASAGVASKIEVATDRTELDEVFETMIFFLSKNFRSYTCIGYLSSDGGRTFHLSAVLSQAGSKLDKEKIVVAGKGAVGKASLRQAGFCSGNVVSYSDPVEYYSARNVVNSLMLSRIFDVDSGNIVGLLVVDSQMREAFSQEHKALLDRFALVASQLISNVRLSQRLKRQNMRSEQAYKMAAYFAQQSSVASILKGIVSSYPAIFGADRFFFCDRSGETGRVVNLFGASEPLAEGMTFDLRGKNALVPEVFRTGTPKLLGTGEKGVGRFAEGDGDAPAVKSFLAAPLFDETGAVTAVTGVEKGTENFFGVDSLVLMQILNANATTAIAKARVFAHLERLATVDGLTGIPNHRQFQTLLDKEISRHRRSGEKLSLLLLDIDHFKNFNDSYGHQLGDEVLRTVAQALQKTIRAGDHAARYGGEEFVVILERTGAAEAPALAERVRQAVADARVSYEGGDLQVTVSVGVAVYPDDADSKSALIHKADLALYASKHAGRDRVTLFGAVTPEEAAAAEELHA